MPQNAMAEYARIGALKQQTAASQAATQGQQIQNQQQQLQLDQTKAVNQAYQGAFKRDANGNLTLDTDGLQQSLAANGHGAAIPSIMKGMTDYQKSRGELQEQQQTIQTKAQDALGSLGYAMQQAKYDPQLAHTIIQDHLNDPSLSPQQKQQLQMEQQQIVQNPAMIKQIADQWVAQSPAEQAKEIQRQEAAAKQTTAGAEQQKADQANWEVIPTLGLRVNKTTGESTPVSGATMPMPMMEAKYVQLQAKKASGQPVAPEDAAFMKGMEKYKTLVPTANINLQAGLLDQQAKDMAAEYYKQTGALPAGMRSPAMSAGILNTAAGAPGGGVPDIRSEE